VYKKSCSSIYGVDIMKRKQYLKEFKIKVCKDAINTGNAANIARHYDICPKMVNRWVKEYKDGKYYG
jgi:transposase